MFLKSFNILRFVLLPKLRHLQRLSDDNAGDFTSDLSESDSEEARPLLVLTQLLLHLLGELRLSWVVLVELLLSEMLEGERAELWSETPPQTGPAIFGADV